MHRFSHKEKNHKRRSAWSKFYIHVQMAEKKKIDKLRTEKLTTVHFVQIQASSDTACVSINFFLCCMVYCARSSHTFAELPTAVVVHWASPLLHLMNVSCILIFPSSAVCFLFITIGFPMSLVTCHMRMLPKCWSVHPSTCDCLYSTPAVLWWAGSILFFQCVLRYTLCSRQLSGPQ